MFQMGGVGPMMGQANVFFRYLPEKIPVAIERYQNESRRLLQVLDTSLRDHEYLAGDFSIANWCWACTCRWSGLSIDGLPHLAAWIERIAARATARKDVKVPYEVEAVHSGGDTDETRSLARDILKMVQR